VSDQCGGWHFHSGQTDAAEELVLRFHYSRRTTTPWFVGTAHGDGGLFGDFGPAVAAVVFSPPPAQWGEEVYELSRLVRHPSAAVPLTWLISQACVWIRRTHPEADLLVSFADPAEGHHGGVYQAASWRYAYRSKRDTDGLFVNGVFVPGRTCNARWGTRSALRLRESHPEWQIEYSRTEGKHLYWRALRRSGQAKAARLGLQSLPYPKPNREQAA
jgi:hypothetical protein